MDVRHATAAVEDCLEDLDRVVHRVRASGDIGLFMEEFERWKRRSTATLRDHLSSEEAARFNRLQTRPNWVMRETADAPVERHGHFLMALLMELDEHPNVATRKLQPPLRTRATSSQKKRDSRSVNAWLNQEAARRGRVWAVILAILTIALSILGVL